MATLTIEGQTVTVDDAFRSMSPEDQGRAVEEIASSLKIAPMAAALSPAPDTEAQTYGGSALNATAGLNEGLYGTLGAPVDLMRGALNLGIKGINAVAGSEIDPLPDTSFMGGRWIGEQLGSVHPVLDPQNTKAENASDRIYRMAGQGVGAAIAPEAAIGLAARAPSLARSAAVAGPYVGQSRTTREALGAAAVGGASGLGSGAAVEVAPEPWKPLAAVAGGMAAGVPASVVVAAPRAAMTAKDAVADQLAPLSQTGRERLAGQRLVDAAADPQAVREVLDDLPAPLVEGSQPTTFQVTGDTGLGALERGATTQRPELFAQRRADQNTARVSAIANLETGGSPETVSRTVRHRFNEIDAETQGAMEAALSSARAQAASLGEGASPLSAGTSIREALEASRGLAKDRENLAWKAVDPEGSLSLAAPNLRTQASSIMEGLPRSAKPIAGEEAEIFAIARGYPDVVSFGELTALSSRLKAEMRAERMANGESPVYRRLSMLNSAAERDLDLAVTSKAAQEADEIRVGRRDPADTVERRIEAVSTPSVGDAVFTPSGRKVGVRYEIAEADSLVTSNTPEGRVNPSYPLGLQPRDRNRAASNAQISSISRNLQPERLGASTSPVDGAPIVGPDGIVESGNGRVLGIRGAFRENGPGARAYREYLASQGYDTTGFREPLLVRRRTSPLDEPERATFAQESNASPSLAMSASEQAAADASRVDTSLLGLYRGGDVSNQDNLAFAKGFLAKVPDKGQEGAFVTADGSLSLDGAQRIRNALLSSAYREPRLVAALADEGDDNIRAFGRALTDISGDVARLRSSIDAGQVDPVADVSRSLVEAAQVVQRARARGVKLSDAVAQQDAFSAVSPDAMTVLRIAYGPSLSSRLSRDKLAIAMRAAVVEAERQSVDARLFGQSLDAAQILDGTYSRYGPATVSEASSNAGVSSARPRGYEGGATNGRPEPLQAGQAAPTGVRGSPTGAILDQPGLTPNFDQQARERLNAARDATKERVGTFDNRTLGPIRRRPGTTAPYDMPASTVPSRIFFAGPASVDAIASFRAAVGEETAFRTIAEYAVDRARAAAMKDDGTFDPNRLQAWRKSHAEALKSFPGLDASLSNATRASEAVTDMARFRKATLDDFQEGKIGAILKVDDPKDVIRTIGGIFSRDDSTKQMLKLRGAIGNDKDALQGLRKSVVEHVMERFIGNMEVATSGQQGIKSDGFQTFVKRSKGALKTAGFNDAEISNMEAIAADLQRANRSLNAVRTPGQSNTAQDQLQVQKNVSVLGRIISSVAGATGAAGGAILGGPITAGIGALGTTAVTNMQRAGIDTIDDLVVDALLNPTRARALMMKAGPGRPNRGVKEILSRTYQAASVSSNTAAANQMTNGAMTNDDMPEVSIPASRSTMESPQADPFSQFGEGLPRGFTQSEPHPRFMPLER